MSDLKLHYPVPFGKVTVDTLQFRDRIIAEDYLADDLSGATQATQARIANIAGVDEALIRALDSVDYTRCVEKMNAMIRAADREFEALFGKEFATPEKKSLSSSPPPD